MANSERTKDLSGAREGRAAKSPRTAASRPAPKTAGPRDAGAARRAAKRAAARKRNSLIWGSVAVLSVVMGGAAAGVYSETKWVRDQIAIKQDTLVDLRAQEEAGSKRLKALTDSGGRVRALVENGFIKPGQRLLLMERTPEEMKAAARKPNDLVQRPEQEKQGLTARLGRAWKELRGG